MTTLPLTRTCTHRDPSDIQPRNKNRTIMRQTDRVTTDTPTHQQTNRLIPTQASDGAHVQVPRWSTCSDPMRSSAKDRMYLTFSRAHARRRFMDETEKQIEQSTHTHNVYTLAHTHACKDRVESRRQSKPMTGDDNRPTIRQFKTRLPVHSHIDGLLSFHRRRIQEGRLHCSPPPGRSSSQRLATRQIPL